MPLHERMERGAVAGGGAKYEIRIGRRAIAAVHCQEYDANRAQTVDRRREAGKTSAANLNPVYCLDAFVTFQLF